jgi:hypothetical protein
MKARKDLPREDLQGFFKTVLLNYCKVNKLEQMCADDILHTYPNLTDDQREWLTTFGKMWDKIQEL